MINIILLKNKYKLIFLIITLMTQIACTQLNAKTVNEKSEKIKMNQQFLSLTLWEVADAIPALIPMNKNKIEKLFDVKLLEKKRNEYTTFFDISHQIKLKDGILIGDESGTDRIDLRLRNDQQSKGFLVLNISSKGSCITAKQLKEKYPDLGIPSPSMPQPIGPNQAPTNERNEHFSIVKSWGKLSFSLISIGEKPFCLESIVFDTK